MPRCEKTGFRRSAQPRRRLSAYSSAAYECYRRAQSQPSSGDIGEHSGSGPSCSPAPLVEEVRVFAPARRRLMSTRHQRADKARYGLPEEEGEDFWLFGALTTIKISAEDTAGQYCVIDIEVPPGVGSLARPPRRGRVVLRPRGRVRGLHRRRAPDPDSRWVCLRPRACLTPSSAGQRGEDAGLGGGVSSRDSSERSLSPPEPCAAAAALLHRPPAQEAVLNKPGLAMSLAEQTSSAS